MLQPDDTNAQDQGAADSAAAADDPRADAGTQPSEAGPTAEPSGDPRGGTDSGTEGAAASEGGPEQAADALTNPEDAATDVGETVTTYLERFAQDFQTFIEDPSLNTAWDAFGPPLLSIGQAVVILVIVAVVTTMISKWLSGIVGKLLRKTRLEETVANFLTLAVRIAVWVLALPVALAIFGVDATALAALIGAAGLAIGLSLQGSLSNIAAGVVLAVIRPMRVGDYVEISDSDIGVVKEVGMFHTVVTTFNNVRVFVPNAEVLSARIENFTANSARRVDLPVGVAYGTDLEHAERVLLSAAKNDVPTRFRGEEPKALLTAFGASSIDFEVQVFCPAKEFLQVRHEAVLAVDKACKANGITIAFPQRDLHFMGPLTIRHENGRGGDDTHNTAGDIGQPDNNANSNADNNARKESQGPDNGDDQ